MGDIFNFSVRMGPQIPVAAGKQIMFRTMKKFAPKAASAALKKSAVVAGIALKNIVKVSPKVALAVVRKNIPATALSSCWVFNKIDGEAPFLPLKIIGAVSVAFLGFKLLRLLIQESEGLAAFEANFKKAENGDMDALNQVFLRMGSSQEQLKVCQLLMAKLPSDVDGRISYLAAFMHYHGYGTQPDLKRAERYLLQAAEKGSASAMYQLGKYYQNHFQDTEKCIHYLSAAARLNCRKAMEELLRHYRDGIGIKPDAHKEAYWRRMIVNYIPDS